MTARASSHLPCALVAAVGLLSLAACAPQPVTAPTGAAPTQETPATTAPIDGVDVVFAMDFDDADALASTPAGAAVVAETSFFGGELSVVPSRSGDGSAIRFPGFSEGEEEPGVGLVVTAADSALPSPGSSSFGFGADVRFDDLSAESDADNGDNVLQRGLAADPAQYKLQVDHGKPSCTVTGSTGRLMAKGDALEGGTWYRLTCLLRDGQLTLTVTDLDAEESAEFTDSGAVGAVEFADNVPVAIGRKVGVDGAGINKQPDQFNGTMDSVWIGIGAER